MEPTDGVELYDIIRFFRDPDKGAQIILDSVTLEEAQEHCNREDTHGEGWFDGYRKTEVDEEGFPTEYELNG